MRKIITFALVLLTLSLSTLVGCRQKGTMERAGERTDEIIDNVKSGDPLLKKKGPLEKTGEAIDNTVRDMKN